MPRPALFLDRDGVIIENNSSYVRSVAEAIPIPGALAALARFARARPDWQIVIVTNQAGVGRGRVSRAAVEAINAFVAERIRAAGGRLDGVYVCPHRPEDNCACRKPEPGLLTQAAAELDLDLPASVMVGDNATDMGAARAAGARPILVRTGLGEVHLAAIDAAGSGQVLIAADLAEAVESILSGG